MSTDVEHDRRVGVDRWQHGPIRTTRWCPHCLSSNVDEVKLASDAYKLECRDCGRESQPDIDQRH